MTTRAYSAGSGTDYDLGSTSSPSDLQIDVTLPASEQSKLPIFQDVLILITVHFSNSQYDDISLTEQITFQNLLYTIKFEPQENSLKANLLASSNQVIRDETLILDASNSFISNMPQSVQRRSLGFRWNCPEPFIKFCRAKVGDRLEITQADLNSLSK